MADAPFIGIAPPSRAEHRERELSDARRAELADDFARRMSARDEALVRVGGRESVFADPSRASGAARLGERLRAGADERRQPPERPPGGPASGAAGEHRGTPPAGTRSERMPTARQAEEERAQAFEGEADAASLDEEHALAEALERADAARAERGSDEDEAPAVAAAPAAAALVDAAVGTAAADTTPLPEEGGVATGAAPRVGELAERLVERLDELEVLGAAAFEAVADGEAGSWRFTLSHGGEEIEFDVARRSSDAFVVTLDAAAAGALEELGERLSEIDPRIVLDTSGRAR